MASVLSEARSAYPSRASAFIPTFW